MEGSPHLNAALRFALENMDASPDMSRVQTSAEDREWLRQAIDSMNSGTRQKPVTVTSILEDVNKLLPSENDTARLNECHSLLDSLADNTDLLDRTEDPERAAAVVHLERLLTLSQDAQLQIAACKILGELAQNVKECQEAAVPLIPRLLGFLKEADSNVEVATRSLFALSAVLRGSCSAAVRAFVDNGGLPVLVSTAVGVGCRPLPMQTRAAFLVSVLVGQSAQVKRVLTEFEKEIDACVKRTEDANIKEYLEDTLKVLRRSSAGDAVAAASANPMPALCLMPPST